MDTYTVPISMEFGTKERYDEFVSQAHECGLTVSEATEVMVENWFEASVDDPNMAATEVP